jgi:Tfp pilus assembly protein PilF
MYIRTEAASEFEKAVVRLPQTEAALPERINCLNNWAACMIKLDQPEEAADICSQTLTLEPNNKKARLRR